MSRRIAASFALIAISCFALAQNPFLPLWEHIPDGEPYVFEDPDNLGKYRVYIYGSHDNRITDYCGLDQVVWSAPVEDLGDWRYDGVIFESVLDANGNPLNRNGKGDVLFAPDIAVKTGTDGKKTYYLFPNNQAWGRNSMVARSDRPDGPFEVCNWNPSNPRETVGVLAFDPGVFVDDDGRVYGYWGFHESNGAELDPETMATVKKGSEIVHNMVSGHYQEGEFRFFEASSIRKIKDKYVFIYSKMMQDGEFGLPECNYNIAYAWSDNPLGPFTYGGILIDGRARGLDAEGNVIPTANPYGNTHGSICEINGQWWVFYHRQIGTDEYSRQAMVAPITVEVEEGPGGKVTISEGEYNSEGFRTEGLDPFQKIEAGWACYLINPKGVGHDYPHFEFTGSYIKAQREEPLCPVVNNTSGSVVGYKYINFDTTAGAKRISLLANVRPEGIKGSATIMVGGPDKARGGVRVGKIKFRKNEIQEMQVKKVRVNALRRFSGKQPLYFVFKSSTEDVSICELYDFTFSK